MNAFNQSIMPLLFLGHGSPLNAIDENEFIEGFRNISKNLPIPKSILCISAHWLTKGTYVTAMTNPKTIHDFVGFPKELYEVQYPAPGNPTLAEKIKNLINSADIELDYDWGLDHGAWSVIKHFYPKANIPIVQLSLDMTKPAKYHYNLAKELAPLRKEEILIIASGNIVHNLRLIDWDKFNVNNFSFKWAKDMNEQVKKYILNKNHSPLIEYDSQGESFKKGIPTPDHFLPLLYVLALQKPEEKITFFNDKAVAGSLTMTSLKID